MGVFGDILHRQYDQEDPLYYVTERDDSYIGIRGVFLYFSKYNQFPEGEKQLLAQVSGKTIELAAGAGRISLYLQNNRDDVDILATDVLEQLLQLCRQRGIEKTMQLDLLEFRSWKQKLDGPVDSFIIFGNSIGVVDNPDEMIEFLQELWDLTSSNGIVIGDFLDALETDNPDHLNYHEKNRKEGKPPGLVNIRVRIDKQIGDWFSLWMPSAEEFREVVDKTDWNIELFGDRLTYFKLFK